MKGIGELTLGKLRDLERRGGWIEADEWFRLHGTRGNRLPLIMMRGLMSSFGFCYLSDKGEACPVRICYRLTDAGRELIRGRG
jgi:hypothetical protein